MEFCNFCEAPNTFPLKTLKLGWAAFHSVPFKLKCLDSQSNQYKKLVPNLSCFCSRLLSSHSSSVRDFSYTSYKPQELRRLFVDAIQSIQGNCYLSISLQAASINEPIEPSDRCFDFTDGFKHFELSYFALLTAMQHKKSKRERQIIVRLFSSLS